MSENARRRTTVYPCPGGVRVTFHDTKLFDESYGWGLFKEELEHLAEQDIACVWLDMRTVEFVSTTFLGVLLALHKRLQAKGARLVIVPSVGIAEVCALTKLDQVMEFAPDVPHADN